MRRWSAHRRYKEQGFVDARVSVDSDPALVTPFLERLKLTFPVAIDAKMELATLPVGRCLELHRDGSATWRPWRWAARVG